MRITFMSLNYIPSTGGLVSYIKNLCQYMTEQGNEDRIRIITTDAKDPRLCENEYINGVNVRRIRAFKFSKFLYLFAPFQTVKNIMKELGEIEFDDDEIIIIRHLYFAYAASKVLQKNMNKIYIIPLIAPRLQKMNKSQVGWIKKLYYSFIIPQLDKIERYALKNINYVGVLSHSKKNEVADYYDLPRGKINIIYPGIDIKKFRPLKETNERERLLKDLNLMNLSNTKVLVTVCRLVSEKNMDYLIKAIKEIKGHEFKLIIVGDGPLKDSIQKQINTLGLSEKIIFLGFRDDVELLYRISDVFILPSKYEGFGHVFLEALACGIPCIGLKNNPPQFITATDEIIDNGVNGFIVDGRDHLELSASIIKLISNEELLEEFKKKARIKVERNFTWEKHLEEIKRIICKGEIK